MAYRKELWRRLSYLMSRSRFQSELNDEVQFHVESRVEELERSGVPRKEALALARREFGSAARAMEDTHGAWQFRWLEDLLLRSPLRLPRVPPQPGVRAHRHRLPRARHRRQHHHLQHHHRLPAQRSLLSRRRFDRLHRGSGQQQLHHRRIQIPARRAPVRRHGWNQSRNASELA